MEKIEFNKKLYKKNTITSGIKTYSEFADFDMLTGDSHFTVEVSVEDPESEKLICNEFGNFVLINMIENRK